MGSSTVVPAVAVGIVANGPSEGAPILVRWTLHRPSGRLTETVLDDRGNEFPRINGRHGSQAYRYIYTAHWGEDVAFGPAMKHDLPRETTAVHDFWSGPDDIRAGLRATAGSRRRRRRLDHVLRTEQAWAKMGVKQFHSRARFVGPTTLAVGDERLTGRRVLIAAGAMPMPLTFPGSDRLTTSDQFLELERLPPRIVFVGDGYVSFEFAHIAARAGARVTILHRAPGRSRPSIPTWWPCW